MLRKRRVGVYEPRVYDMFMSDALVRYDGRIHEETLKLMKELSQLGLAGRVPLYTSKGEYITDAYRAPPEVAYVLEEYSSDFDFGEARKLFLAADLLSKASRRDLTKRELLVALEKLDVPEDEVKLALELMYRRGITSRYNEAGGPESPAFLVLDREAAKEEAERLVGLVEDYILSE